MNEPTLPDHIALRQPPDLPFAHQMHRLITVIVLIARMARELDLFESNHDYGSNGLSREKHPNRT